MLPGDTIGKYRLVTRLGRGGMGEVWLATASGYGGFAKKVVLKTLLPELSTDPLFIDLLANEARVCAKLSHPNLIEVFDFTEHEGVYLLAMEHIVGRPLHQIMRAAAERQWAIPDWFALRIAWECCRGLECAHEHGVIHCDLSPSNVMVTFAGITKILDFGVAHSSAMGPKTDRLKGKFSYMAPERIKSLVTDRRTDIYSLGVMLYLMFTGQLPFVGATDHELLSSIVNDRPRPPSELCSIDPRIEQLILRAMQPDPAARHQNVGELMASLAPCLEGQLGTYGQHEVAGFVAALMRRDADVDASTGTHEIDVDDIAEEDEIEGAFDAPDAYAAAFDLDSAELAIPREQVVKDQTAAARHAVRVAAARHAAALLSPPIPPLPSSTNVRATAPTVPATTAASAARHATTPGSAAARSRGHQAEPRRTLARGSGTQAPLAKPLVMPSPAKPSPVFGETSKVGARTATAFENIPDFNDARTTVQSLFERGQRSTGNTTIFDRAPRDATDEPIDEPLWPWPRSRSKTD